MMSSSQSLTSMFISGMKIDEEEQSQAIVDMPYIDRIVFGVENDAGEDADIINAATGDVAHSSEQVNSDSDGHGELGDVDSHSNCSRIGGECDEEYSYEFEYHSDDASGTNCSGNVCIVDTPRGGCEDGQCEEGELDSHSNWSESCSMEFLYVDLSDDDLEYDSDEESSMIEIFTGEYEPKCSKVNISDESKLLLLWRLDKNDSFSDWTIEILTTGSGRDTGNETQYHVHRSILGAGPQKSGYFEALFKSHQFNEAWDNMSKVQLEDDVAADFPGFLDYMYSHPSECNCIIQRENRRSLQYLANYFLVSKLTEAIEAFIEEDMHNLDHIQGYLCEFPSAEDSDYARKVHSMIARVCAKMILHIDNDSSLLVSLTPAMILSITSSLISGRDFHSLQSKVKQKICSFGLAYVKHHHGSLDEQYFHALTFGWVIPLSYTKLQFPIDLAIGLLEITKLTGWEDERVTQICTARVSKYLENESLTHDTIAMTASKLPLAVLESLFTEAVVARNANIARDGND